MTKQDAVKLMKAAAVQYTPSNAAGTLVQPVQTSDNQMLVRQVQNDGKVVQVFHHFGNVNT